MAWWHATPSDPKAKDAAAVSRLKAELDQDPQFEPPLPDVEPETAYLLEALFEAGPLSSNTGGSGPLTWADLQAWQQGTGIELRPWELRVLRRLSSDYASESHKAESPTYPCPYEPDGSAPNARAVAASMRGAIAKLAGL